VCLPHLFLPMSICMSVSLCRVRRGRAREQLSACLSLFVEKRPVGKSRRLCVKLRTLCLFPLSYRVRSSSSLFGLLVTSLRTEEISCGSGLPACSFLYLLDDVNEK